MFLRCRNSKSHHLASLSVELVESGAVPDWTPVKGAEPTEFADGPEFYETPRAGAAARTKDNKEAAVTHAPSPATPPEEN